MEERKGGKISLEDAIPIKMSGDAETGSDTSAQNEASAGQERLRFEVELEFVQCLSNPNYLNWLSRQPFFHDKRFLNYIRYLNGHWRKIEYAAHLQFPQSLFFLEKMQNPDFRRAISEPGFAEAVYTQQGLQWMNMA